MNQLVLISLWTSRLNVNPLASSSSPCLLPATSLYSTPLQVNYPLCRLSWAGHIFTTRLHQVFLASVFFTFLFKALVSVETYPQWRQHWDTASVTPHGFQPPLPATPLWYGQDLESNVRNNTSVKAALDLLVRDYFRAHRFIWPSLT